jgi:hypothetical protein
VGILTPNTIATRAGRVRYAQAVAIMKRLSDMAIPAIRTCIIAIGFATGPMFAWRFMALSPPGIQGSWSGSPKGSPYETPAPFEQEGGTH